MVEEQMDYKINNMNNIKLPSMGNTIILFCSFLMDINKCLDLMGKRQSLNNKDGNINIHILGHLKPMNLNSWKLHVGSCDILFMVQEFYITFYIKSFTEDSLICFRVGILCH